jgi:protocatechuate 3,4-dioxygenase beta subunit
MKNVRVLACLLASGPTLVGQTATSSVEGQVVNAVSGAPVKRAAVSLFRSRSLPTAPGQPASASGAATMETDEQGRFAFRNVSPGGYSLTAQRQGFLAQRQGVGPAAVLMVGENQQIGGVVVRLTPHSVIAGKVLDAGGDPVVGVQVLASWQRAPSLGGQAGTTNDLGEYRIPGLVAGNYFVMAGTPRPNAITYSPIYSQEQQPRQEPELAYTSTYYPDALEAAAATPVRVAAGAEVRGIDIKLARAKTVTIAGRVIDPGAPATRPAFVALTLAGSFGFNVVGYAASRADGTFQISSVPHGSYYLIARRSGDEGQMVTGGSAAVEVGDKSLDGVIVQVLPATDVEGFVKSATPGRCGPGRLSLLNESGFSNAPGTNISPDAKFTLKNVIPGTYRVNLPGACYVQSLRFGGREITNMRVTVDGTGPLEITLAASQAMVQGTVADSSGKPLSGATVTFHPKDEAPPGFRTTATTDRAGSFSAFGMRPGAYQVFAWEYVGSAADSPEFLKQFESSSQTIVVEESGRQSVRLTAIPASATGESAPAPMVPHALGGIEGQVINAVDRMPLRTARVTLGTRPASRPRPGMRQAVDPVTADAGENTVETDEQGRFAFSNVEPDFYHISAERQGYTPVESSDRPHMIVVGNGQQITGYIVKLAPQSVIVGCVVDEYGEAVPTVQAVLFRAAYVGGVRRLVRMRMAQTDDLGKFRLSGMASGFYYLAVMRSSLNRFSRLAAQAPANEPQLGSGMVWYPNATDASGAAPITVGAGAEVPVEIVLRRTKVVRIQGAVVNDDGTPAGRTIVTLTPQGLGTSTLIGNLSWRPGGVFEITGVPAGSYILSGRVANDDLQRMAFLPLDVRDSNFDGIQLRLNAGKQVRGTVKWEGDSTQSAFLNATTAEGVSASAQVSPVGGAFTFPNIWPLTYTVNVSGICANCYVKSIRYAGSDVSEAGVDFGEEGELEIVVSASAASLDGVVVDRQRRFSSGATIMLAPVDHPERISSGKTDERGMFHFGGLRPGAYHVFAWDSEAPGASPEGLAPFQTQATTVTLEENAKKELEIAAIRHAS